MKIPRWCVFFLALCFLPPRAWPQDQEVREVHYQMGTFLDIRLWHADREEAKRLLRQAVAEVHRLDKILSNYDPESALSRFNRRAGKGKMRIDPELYRVLQLARVFSAKTSGYFDVTIGPLMELWRRSAAQNRLPDTEVLAETLALVDYRKIKLYPDGQAELARQGMAIDLGGIGKGYAADRVVALLMKAGINRALVNFGGSSIYAMGSPPRAPGWKLGVQATNGKMIGVLDLKNKALATSGSMGRSWKIGGKPFGHLINPKSGIPVSEARMATVVAPSATAAEALTKPFVLLGSKAAAFLEQFPQAEVLLASEKDELWLSDGFASLASFRQAQAP